MPQSGPVAEIKSFQGLTSNQDPADLEPGQAAVQVNVWSARPGELQTRAGIREMTFDTE